MTWDHQVEYGQKKDAPAPLGWASVGTLVLGGQPSQVTDTNRLSQIAQGVRNGTDAQ
jgi:hypothetical protein